MKCNLKYLFVALLLLESCGPSEWQQHLQVVRQACDQGQQSACIEYEDMLAQRRIAMTQMGIL